MLKAEMLETVKLRITNLGKEEHWTEWNYKDVFSPYSRLFYVVEGEIRLFHNEQEFVLREGELNLIPCFNLSGYECPEHTVFYYTHFTARLNNGYDLFNVINTPDTVYGGGKVLSLFKELHRLLPDIAVKVCQPHSEEDKKSCLKQLQKVEGGLTPCRYFNTDGIFRQIIAHFFENMSEVDTLPQQHFVQVLEYIENHLDQPITLDDLAAITNLHPNYFSQQFKKAFGIRPIEYLLRQRVEHAQNLLFGRAHTVKEIAELTGFCDVPYFSRTFKKFTGTSPSKYISELG